MVSSTRACSPAENQAIRSRSACAASGVKMCSTPAASCARNCRNGQKVWLSAPEAISRTFRSDCAIAAPSARPSRRLSSTSAVWQTPIEIHRFCGRPWPRNSHRFVVA